MAFDSVVRLLYHIMYTIRDEDLFVNANCKNCNKNFDRNCTVLKGTFDDQNGMKKASI
jgi:hypothetical protein